MRLLDLLLPQTCPACRLDVGAAEALCAACRGRLVPAEPPCCLRCAEPLRSGRTHCVPCSSRLFACGLIRSAFLYRGSMPPLVHAFKYSGRVTAARAAGQWMAQASWTAVGRIQGGGVRQEVSSKLRVKPDDRFHNLLLG